MYNENEVYYMKYKKYDRPLTIALEPATHEKIRIMSEEKRVSMAEIVRDILTEALSKS
jgi:predicted HicB family RNase H-like nuclease